MPKFELIESKKPHELVTGDHIIMQDRFWRVEENYAVLGFPSNRMLMLMPHQIITPRGFRFLEITTESRIEAYKKTE